MGKKIIYETELFFLDFGYRGASLIFLNLVIAASIHARVELAKCIGNPACAANVACLQTCNDRPDETECQVSF